MYALDTLITNVSTILTFQFFDISSNPSYFVTISKTNIVTDPMVLSCGMYIQVVVVQEKYLDLQLDVFIFKIACNHAEHYMLFTRRLLVIITIHS